jgi:sec-independent protein translocase protein TatB
MNGVGGPELLVVLVVALLVFGPKSIPEVARTLGRGMRELRRLATEFQREVNLADAHAEEARRPSIRPERVAPPEPASDEPPRSETPPKTPPA